MTRIRIGNGIQTSGFTQMLLQKRRHTVYVFWAKHHRKKFQILRVSVELERLYFRGISYGYNVCEIR